MTTQTSISSETLTAFRVEIADKYRLERELGRGGMATVYLARDLANDRYVAVKVLLPELAATLGAERFLREIEVGKTLQHPNIVGVLDSGAADGKLFYTMPFIEGASLRDRLDIEKQLSIDETITLAHQVADALDFAHSKGIIHRDIKPENILLSDGKALVADFGIARAVTVAGGMTLTKTGMAIGTPTYMSPEQAMGSKDVTPESDIYSLACVIYELLAALHRQHRSPAPRAALARQRAELEDRARHRTGRRRGRDRPRDGQGAGRPVQEGLGLRQRAVGQRGRGAAPAAQPEERGDPGEHDGRSSGRSPIVEEAQPAHRRHRSSAARRGRLVRTLEGEGRLER
jgi:serine/threonine protein kinase